MRDEKVTAVLLSNVKIRCWQALENEGHTKFITYTCHRLHLALICSQHHLVQIEYSVILQQVESQVLLSIMQLSLYLLKQTYNQHHSTQHCHPASTNAAVSIQRHHDSFLHNTICQFILVQSTKGFACSWNLNQLLLRVFFFSQSNNVAYDIASKQELGKIYQWEIECVGNFQNGL